MKIINQKNLMNKMLFIFTSQKEREFEITIKKLAKEELVKAREFSKESRYENPIHAMHSGTPVNKNKLFFRPDFKNYCPV
jgi:hypothetical protein